MTFIRYFASMDSSPSGCMALAHLDAMREVAGLPIRLIRVGGAAHFDARGGASWQRHIDLVSTPIESSYINVVCSEAIRWGTLWTNKLVKPGRGIVEHPSGCLKNVLIQTESNTVALAAVVARYDYVLNQENVILANASTPSNKQIAYRRVNVARLKEALALAATPSVPARP